MRKTKLQLADGRDIFYFDFDTSSARNVPDQRKLDRHDSQQAAMRYDILTGEWVSIAGHRQKRIYHPNVNECPLCPSTQSNMSEIPEHSYNVVVFENRFPSFEGNFNQEQSAFTQEWGGEIPASGRCEVIAYSDKHDGCLGNLSSEQMKLVISAWIDRNNELSTHPNIDFVFIFENRGAEVGVTLHHPHGQIYGYPFLPTYMNKLLSQGKKYREIHNRSMLDDVVAKELLADERIVFQDRSWVVFVPHAARWPYEIQVHPLRSISSISELNDVEIEALSSLIPMLINALDGLFDNPLPYMAGWIQGPAKESSLNTDSRLFLRIVSVQRSENKLKFLAGSESLMGAWISDILPEVAAEKIRTAIAKVQQK